MKRIVLIILCVLLCFSVCGCGSEIEQDKSKRSQEEQFIFRVRSLETVFNSDPEYLSEEDMAKPLYQDSMSLPDEKTWISLYALKRVVHIYNLTQDKNLELSKDDVTDLYFNQGNKTHDWSAFILWHYTPIPRLGIGSSEIVDIYIAGIKTALEQYEQKNNRKFNNKEYEYLDFDEILEFEIWLKSNPDKSLAKENYNYCYLLKLIGVQELSVPNNISDKQQTILDFCHRKDVEEIYNPIGKTKEHIDKYFPSLYSSVERDGWYHREVFDKYVTEEEDNIDLIYFYRTGVENSEYDRLKILKFANGVVVSKEDKQIKKSEDL